MRRTNTWLQSEKLPVDIPLSQAGSNPDTVTPADARPETCHQSHLQAGPDTADIFSPQVVCIN